MKNSILKFTALLIFSAIGISSLQAKVILPSIFGDNMVLQQQTSVAFWGKAVQNASVTVKTSWNSKTYTVRSDKNGNWKVMVSTPVAGGPFTVTVNDGTALTLKNIMIGEVWLCSGQSNMEMPMKGYRNQPVSGSNEFIAFSSNNNIRLITIPRNASLSPVDDFDASWKLCEPENVSEFSATAYFFGLKLYKALNVPVGLICTSWGGTRIEPWMSAAGLKNFDWVKIPDGLGQATGNLSPQTPTVLYNAMINPVAGFGIKGAIWYQGEANRNEFTQYKKLLPGLVADWRTIWQEGDFPFYYVQIAPFNYGEDNSNSAFLREAQLKAVNALPGMGMACLMDCGERDCIHPANKEVAGTRLAYLALSKTYGKKGFACEGPVLKDMKIDGSQIKLTFDNAPNGLTAYGKGLYCFEVAGSNKRFYHAEAYITPAGVNVFSPSVPEPVAVRYAFKDFIIGDLFNTEGLPATSFRTDNWDVE